MIFDCDGRSDVRKGRGEERSEKRRREEKEDTSSGISVML